jgi:hypothetical protein
MNYGFLLESVWHPPLAFEEVAAPKLPPELELQALWFSGAFGRDFRLRDGRVLRITQFGEWNHGAVVVSGTDGNASITRQPECRRTVGPYPHGDRTRRQAEGADDASTNDEIKDPPRSHY